MFQPRAVAATMPAQDFERAKSFYSEKLGLTPVREGPGEAVYDVNGMEFVIFPSSGKASGDHTQMGFEVDDLDGAVSSLRDRGVAFEEYDMPDFKNRQRHRRGRGRARRLVQRLRGQPHFAFSINQQLIVTR
jgi:catechol 2,3-dioxygenase-like lactoylglutathione lyase family enzyme